MILNSYLNFSGNCEEAFNFYKSVFGGEFTYLARFKEIPLNPGVTLPESDMEKIMHVALPISKETILMGSDITENFPPKFMQGNNISMYMEVKSPEEADNIFGGLSQDGNILMAMEKTFWGAYFGQLIDKFGINWMISCELAEGQKM